MKKHIFLFFLFCFFTLNVSSQSMFSVSKGEVSFYSDAPIEDIEAHNKQPGSMINTSTREIAVVIPIRNFQFAKQLMQEHFNEKYMESEKFPMASFKGIIQQEIDFTRDSTYDVTAKGTITIHGVEKEVVLTGKLKVTAGELTLDSKFKVALKDYNISVPKLLFENIAEVIDVTISLTYQPYHKK
ncbi:MAG: YceI family protein [Bacteroidetes bacterium]|nr:YceI family protein [Bacteroidota bacterium]